MQIDLRECETLVINLPEDTARRANMTQLCDRLGLNYRFIEGIKCAPGRIGATLSHARAYRAGRPGRPLLVLEDDLAATDDFSPIVTIPDDADALYLGTSRYGGLDVVDFVGCLDMIAAQEVGEGLLRIHNMLAAHAVLYVTDKYRLAAEEATIDAMLNGGWQADRALAKIQSHFKIYAHARPTLYQSAAFQSGDYGLQIEEGTKTPVELHPIGMVLSLVVLDQRHDLWLTWQDGRLVWLPCKVAAET